MKGKNGHETEKRKLRKRQSCPIPRPLRRNNEKKRETGKVERVLAIPDLMLGRYTVSLPTFPLHSYEP